MYRNCLLFVIWSVLDSVPYSGAIKAGAGVIDDVRNGKNVQDIALERFYNVQI